MGRKKSGSCSANPAMPCTRAGPAKQEPRKSVPRSSTRLSRNWMSSRSSAAVVTLALSLITQSLLAQSPFAVLQRDIDALLAAPALERAFWGVLVKPVDRDEVVYSLNAGKLMTPASTMK